MANESSLLKSSSVQPSKFAQLVGWCACLCKGRQEAGGLCPHKRPWHVLSSCGWEACMRACKPSSHKEPPARSLMWATQPSWPHQPGPPQLLRLLTQSRGRVFERINYLGEMAGGEDWNGVKWLHHRGRRRDSGELAGCAGKVVWCRAVGPTTALSHHCCCVSQHFTTHGTGQAIHTPAQLLLCSTAIPRGSAPRIIKCLQE